MIFSWACAPSVVHVRVLLQQLVFGGRSLFQMSSVSTSNCHPIHAERSISQAPEKKNEHFLHSILAKHLAVGRAPKKKAVHPLHVAPSRRTCLKSARTSRVAFSPTAVQQDSLREHV